MASYFKSLSMIMMTSNKTKEEWRVIKNLLEDITHSHSQSWKEKEDQEEKGYRGTEVEEKFT